MNTSTDRQAEKEPNYELLDTEKMKIPFGQYAGKELGKVPRNYKIWLLTQTLRSFPALYTELRLHVIGLLRAEARAEELASYQADLERIASREDLV